MAKYELTKDLETGNALIDSEHRQLLNTINDLMEACSQGKGRDKIQETAKFLVSYVKKHFGDEEALQTRTNYAGYPAHKQFHTSYTNQIIQIATEIEKNGANISTLSKINQAAGVLVSHIRIEDKKLAQHVKAQKG